MTLIEEPILGLESIQREALIVFFDQLNEAIDRINTFMATSDQALATHMGQPYVPTVVEHVAPGNFYEGHRPSLIEAPIDKYPNLAVWAVRTTPAPESALLDQTSVSRTLLYVEVMTKASPEEVEGVVNRRIMRTIEAVNYCVMANPTLNGIVSGADGEPSVLVSEVFTRKERTAYGPHWFWQGARLEYAVRKEAALPSSSPSGSIFRSASPVAGNSSGFDYSQFIDQG